MKSIVKIAIVLSSPLLVINPAFSQVSTVSSENLVQIGKDAYWSANVSCEANSERTIQRKTDGSEWCGKEVSGFCANSKDAAAKKVCGTEYSSALSLKESSIKAKDDAEKAQKSAERDRALLAERDRADRRRVADQRLKQQQQEKARQAAAPLKKQISIEEQLILIEQEKLDLRRQELELQRRAAEIEKLLEK